MTGADLIIGSYGGNTGGALYMRLADDILSYIRETGIRPGMRIPSERKLAEMFHTSRASVREAVRILHNKGIIDIQVGNGMYLKNTLTDEACKIELWKINYMEVLDIKTVLEFHIIEELCRYVGPAELLAIENALKKLEEGYAQGIYDQAADTLFHKRIRACSANTTLVQLVDNLLATLDAYGLGLDEFNKYWFTTVPYHRTLYTAITEHDVAKAKEAYYTIARLDKEALDVIQKNKQAS